MTAETRFLPCENVWGTVKTNRHKLNKPRDCSDEHLAGRLVRIRAWLLESSPWPKVYGLLSAETTRIEEELARRERGHFNRKVTGPILEPLDASFDDLAATAPGIAPVLEYPSGYEEVISDPQ